MNEQKKREYDRDELVAALNACAADACDPECPGYDDQDCHINVIEQAAQQLDDDENLIHGLVKRIEMDQARAEAEMEDNAREVALRSGFARRVKNRFYNFGKVK